MRPAHRYLGAGGSPASCSPFLLRQERCTKEGDPIHRPFGVPCAARQAGRLRNSAFASDSPRRHPPARLRCSAAAQGESKNTPSPSSFPLGKEPSPLSPAGRGWGGGSSGETSPTRPQTPFCAASICGKLDAGEHCSSSAAAGLCAAGRVSAAARFCRQTEGSPQGRRGRVSFCLVTCILGKQNKVTCCRAAPGI